MARLPTAMPRTIRTADHLLRSTCPADTRQQAGDLLLALAVVECQVSTDGPAAVPAELLRDLVIITARLAGRAWLKAHADASAAFAELANSPEPPPLPELDRVLTRLLSDRFALVLSAAAI